METKSLSNKVCVVTGGTRGIGKAIVRKFFHSGAEVVILGTNAEKGREVIEELKKEVPDRKIAFYQLDVKNSVQIEEIMESIYKDFGKIDVLVNNAGITRDNLLMRLTDADWEAVMDTNLKSVFHMCRAVIRPMIKGRVGGKIINVTSVVALTGNAGQTNYAASKSGMVGFTKSLAKEVGSRGITVNCIAPGFIKTDMTAALNPEQQKKIIEQIPMGKIGEPEHIADAALFLASSASDYMTGQVLTVDGGMVMS